MTARHGLFAVNGTAGVTSASEARLALASLLSGVGVVNGSKSGSVTGSTSGPNMKYTVPSMTFVTARGAVATDGYYLWDNDGNVTIDSGAPAPSSGTRYDVIYALHRNFGDGDANSDPLLGVAVGTASATPAVPAIPAGALEIARSLVGTSIANASLATITQTAPVAYVGTPPVVTYDSGWLPLTLGQNGFVIPSGGSPAYVAEVRQIGKLVKFRGYLQNTTFASSTPTTAAILPAGIDHPNVNEQAFPVPNNNSTIGRAAFVQPGGSVQFNTTGATSAFYSLGGIAYLAD